MSDLHPETRRVISDGPRTGIVVVTRNRRETLLRTLRRLEALEDTFPIVVVDNSSTDGTPEAVRRDFPRVRVLARRDNLGGVARTFGARALECPYIAFADDDSWWARGALSEAIKLFDAHPRLGLIMSRILVNAEEKPDPCCDLMRRSPLPGSPDLPGIPILGFLACGVVVRRSAFLQVGGFDRRFGTGGEELLFGMDLAANGWGLSYVDSLVSHHYPSKLRDETMRRTEGVRDELWTAWLRRSPRRVLLTTYRILPRMLTSRPHRAGFVQALKGLPWVIRERRTIPASLERQLEMLDRQREKS